MNMAILAESAVRVTLLAFGVAVVLRALQIRSPRLAHAAWTVVTVVMLLLPVLVAWGPRFAVPLLPMHTTGAILAPGGGDVAAAKPEGVLMIVAASEGSQPGMPWATVGVVVYVGGVGILLLRLAMGLRRARAMRRGVLQTTGRLTHPDCVTPITVGLVAPAVILPTDWANWDEAELSAVLDHEGEHVRRRDPLVNAVALLNRAIFWFHPLAWWLPREIVRLSEQACDVAVISRGHDSDVYSACLLRFARRAAEAGGRIVPMATAVSGPALAERLGMLTRPQTARPSGLRLACAAVAFVAFVVVCAAAAPIAAPVQDGALRGQSASGPSFDVASIKKNLSADEIAEGGFMPGGRISAINVTLVNLMVAAYNVPPDRIEGGPSWSRSDRFDVVATGDRNATVAETRLMLRSLLAERFALNSRTVARERPIFALLPARDDRRPGPQLRLTDPKCAASRTAVESAPPEGGPPSPTDPPCGRVAFGGGLLSGRAATVDQIATPLSGLVGRPVVNRSAFDGLYDFEMRFSRPAANPGPTDPPEIFTALREQLGLRLEPGRGPVDVIEIVSAAQPSVD